MDDGIIDFTQYLERRRDAEGPRPGGAFALWGADGERSRFALPVWRVVYLAGGQRGGILRREEGAGAPGALEPFVVLDLHRDPADLDFSPSLVDGLGAARAPALTEGEEGGLAILLGEDETSRWYLVVESDEPVGLAAREREDILFLAGECAGLLFLRNLAGTVGEPDD